MEQRNINLSISGHFYSALRLILIKFDLLTGGQNRCYLNGREKPIEPQGHLQTSVTQYWFTLYWSTKENTTFKKCTKFHSELSQLDGHNYRLHQEWDFFSRKSLALIVAILKKPKISWQMSLCLLLIWIWKKEGMWIRAYAVED